jgi:hypothetical protein
MRICKPGIENFHKTDMDVPLHSFMSTERERKGKRGEEVEFCKVLMCPIY